MNHPHDPLFRWLTLIIAFALGVVVGAVAVSGPPKPVSMTDGQLAAARASSRMVAPGRDGGDRAWAAIWSAAAKVCPYIKTAPPQTVLPVELESCLDRLVPPNNRAGQIPAVTPHPYVLHQGKAPLTDPPTDAYYRKLLEQGRFPVSGSAEGRPASKNDCHRTWAAGQTVHLPAGCMFENPVAEKVR